MNPSQYTKLLLSPLPNKSQVRWQKQTNTSNLRWNTPQRGKSLFSGVVLEVIFFFCIFHIKQLHLNCHSCVVENTTCTKTFLSHPTWCNCTRPYPTHLRWCKPLNQLSQVLTLVLIEDLVSGSRLFLNTLQIVELEHVELKLKTSDC